jgi:hypothetical protein
VLYNVQNNLLSDLGTTTANETQAMTHLQTLASGGYATANCQAAVGGDSWVPNAKSTDFPNVGCKAGTTALPNCTNLSNLAICKAGCYGFTQEIGRLSYNECARYNCTTNAENELTTRYGASPGCLYTFYISRLVLNYDKARQDNLKTLQTSLEQSTSALGVFDEYLTTVNILSGKFSALNAEIQASYSRSIGLNSGIFRGTSCQPVFEQAGNVYSSLCSQTYPFLILFALILNFYLYSLVLMVLPAVLIFNRYDRAYKRIDRVEDSDQDPGGEELEGQ